MSRIRGLLRRASGVTTFDWAAAIMLLVVSLAPVPAAGQQAQEQPATPQAVVDSKNPPADQAGDAATNEGKEDGQNEALTCQDCAAIKRTNPFFGTSNPAISFALFFVFLLVIYLVGVGYFKGSITHGGSIVGAFVLSFGSFLVLAVLIAWVCFQQYTWNSCWCKGLAVPEDGGPVVINTLDALKQVNWLIWALAFGVAIVVVIAIKLMVNRPVAPQDGNSQK